MGQSLTVEIARQMTKNLRRSIAELRAIARDRAGESIIHHDGGNGRDKSHRRRKQGFGDARRHHREIGRIGFRYVRTADLLGDVAVEPVSGRRG